MAVRRHPLKSLRRCSRTGHGRPATGDMSVSPRAILTNANIERGADAGPHQQRGIALCGRLPGGFRPNLVSLVVGRSWQAHRDSEMRSKGESGRRHGRYIVARKRVETLYLRRRRRGQQTCINGSKSEFSMANRDSDAQPTAIRRLNRSWLRRSHLPITCIVRPPCVIFVSHWEEALAASASPILLVCEYTDNRKQVDIYPRLAAHHSLCRAVT